MNPDRLASPAGCGRAAEGHLILRAQAGDEAAFAALFEQHKKRVFSVCLRMTRIPADAEDLTQDVFLLLFRKISMFRGDSAFSTWLYRMAMNVALSHLRKQTSRSVPLDLGAEGERPQPEIAVPDPQLVFCLDRLNLQQAVSHLPPSYRAAFALYELHGYEHREIAEMMNWTVANSKSQLHKARKKLRKWLHLDRSKSPLPVPPNSWARRKTRNIVSARAGSPRWNLAAVAGRAEG